eukprot:CAMPEP_0175099814 /NCGR_PEP_ID=MMETSP0086_2-20121207/6681_1 /TAXON_ID=136419 /ORGANISM="Unknown Unknown, Strain D1" /LENGTH=125 /DNA_ID=CAMNT_0016373737 /DNA_START=567 /DNA_END=942 /DNA_ORIENTATION=+
MVFFPHNLGVFPSSVNLAIDQAFILAHAVEQSSSNASSIFFNRVANKTAVMGHSLGGGTAILASDPTILQHHYPAPQVLVALSSLSQLEELSLFTELSSSSSSSSSSSNNSSSSNSSSSSSSSSS